MSHPNDGRVDFRFLRREIKLALKKKKINYRTLADKLNMSEANVKRQMSSDDCPLNRLNDLCEVAGIYLVDLINSSYKFPVKRSKMTEIQEDYLAKEDIRLKFYFKIAFEKKDLLTAAEELGIDEKKAFCLAKKMDSLELLKLEVNNGITLQEEHLGLWSEDSPIGKLIKSVWGVNFVKQSGLIKNDSCNLYSLRYLWLSESSILEFISRSRELLDEFSRRSRVEDSIFEDTRPLCCLSLARNANLTEVV